MNIHFFIFLISLSLSLTAKGQTSWTNKDYVVKKEKEETKEKEEKEEKEVQEEIVINKESVNKADINNERFINPLRPKDWVHINSKYGERNHPVLHRKKHHGGIDIPVPTGTPVYAVLSGKIIVSTENSINGKYIKIEHSKGYSTMYLHLSVLNVTSGDYVKQGQIIAYSGATGRVTGAHLHYEVRLNGVRQNPENFLLFN